MTWIHVLNEDLTRFFYADYGMEEPAEVTTNGKAQVPDEVAQQLYDHPSGDFAPNNDDDAETDT
jgi:hypothetical protein